jgi:phosphatidylserine/phosphatidylglycerophosphate/cardiolipin synthase-like enzyme
MVPAAEPFTLVTEPDQGIAPIQALITSARHRVDMTMYELEDEPTEQLLADAAARGVTVRVILDHRFSGTHNDAAAASLSAHGVAVHWAPSIYAITHQKTVVVDGQVAAIMTLNLTRRYYATSRDLAVLDRDAADVAAVETVFGADFDSRAVGTPQGDDLVWSPGQSASALPSLIASARRSLLVENEEMADPAIIDALDAAAQRGVDVEVCMTDSSRWHHAFDTLTSAGAHVVTYASTALLYIHAKAIVVDSGTQGARVFVGSENFSAESLDHNRELGVLLGSAPIVDGVARTIESDLRGGRPWP